LLTKSFSWVWQAANKPGKTWKFSKLGLTSCLRAWRDLENLKTWACGPVQLPAGLERLGNCLVGLASLERPEKILKLGPNGFGKAAYWPKKT